MQDKVAHIYPIKNQELQTMNDAYVMILAHLAKKGLYKKGSFAPGQYVIMDNGAFEKQQVSTKLEDLINIVKVFDLPVNEIVVPDAINDLETTKALFLENRQTMIAHPEYRYMFVAQATTYEELKDAFVFAEEYKNLMNLSIGVSKLSPLERASKEAIKLYKQSSLPIHLLGLKSSFSELREAYPYIRSCDSSQLAYMVKNRAKGNVVEYKRTSSGVDIDLEGDYCCNGSLMQMFFDYDDQRWRLL